MKSRLLTLAVLCLIAGNLILGIPQRVLAQDSNAISKEFSAKIKQGTYFLLGIKERLAKSESEKDLLSINVSKLEGMVADNSKVIRTLSEQLNNIDEQIAANQRKAVAIQIYIAELENSVTTLKNDLTDHQDHMKKVIGEVTSLLRNLYLQASLIYAQNTPEEQVLGLLASNENLSDFSQRKQYSMYVNEATSALVAELVVESDAVTEKTDVLTQKQLVINNLENELSRENIYLSEMRDARTRLLKDTEGKQELYEDLLKTSQQESVNVSLDVSRLKENYDFFAQKLTDFREKIASGASAPTLDDTTSGLNLSQSTLEDITQELKALRGQTELAWPVSPSLGISAFYHDSSYQSAMGAVHQALDIRALQSSKVRAAADGVVTKAADNGFGYSYIIITHPDKFVTLYGHISEINVKEGQIVRQGEVIGLSGGMPGTKGAGWMTTGPHLHFEVFRNFQHVNPLLYLPLELLPKETLDSKYVQDVL